GRGSGSASHSMQSLPEVGKTSVNALLSVYDRSPNPWSIQAGQALSTAITVLSKEVRERLDKASTDTYQQTLEALRANPEGLTAEQVGKLTGRTRNTESAYLWRLYLAGWVERMK